jgi:hypothetical protein
MAIAVWHSYYTFKQTLEAWTTLPYPWHIIPVLQGWVLCYKTGSISYMYACIHTYMYIQTYSTCILTPRLLLIINATRYVKRILKLPLLYGYYLSTSEYSVSQVLAINTLTLVLYFCHLNVTCVIQKFRKSNTLSTTVYITPWTIPVLKLF